MTNGGKKQTVRLKARPSECADLAIQQDGTPIIVSERAEVSNDKAGTKESLAQMIAKHKLKGLLTPMVKNSSKADGLDSSKQPGSLPVKQPTLQFYEQLSESIQASSNAVTAHWNQNVASSAVDKDDIYEKVHKLQQISESSSARSGIQPTINIGNLASDSEEVE